MKVRSGLKLSMKIRIAGIRATRPMVTRFGAFVNWLLSLPMSRE